MLPTGRFFFGGSTSSWMCHPRMWTKADSGRSLARATQRTRWYWRAVCLRGSLRDNQWWRHPLFKAFLFLRKGWWLFLGKGTFFWVSWWCDDGTWDVNISYPVPEIQWISGGEISTNSCESWAFSRLKMCKISRFFFWEYHVDIIAGFLPVDMTITPRPLTRRKTPRWFADVLGSSDHYLGFVGWWQWKKK